MARGRDVGVLSRGNARASAGKMAKLQPWRPFAELGIAIGELVEAKNAAYGSSFDKSGEFLRLLFPDGVPAERCDDALLLVRIFDKQMRIATDPHAMGESPYMDIAGYGILGAHQQQKKAGK